jgi:hypothetical protein
MRGVVSYRDSKNVKTIVIGSDHGFVYFLSGELERVETLKVGEPNDRIQILTVSGQFRGFPISANASRCKISQV